MVHVLRSLRCHPCAHIRLAFKLLLSLLPVAVDEDYDIQARQWRLRAAHGTPDIESRRRRMARFDESTHAVYAHPVARRTPEAVVRHHATHIAATRTVSHGTLVVGWSTATCNGVV